MSATPPAATSVSPALRIGRRRLFAAITIAATVAAALAAGEAVLRFREKHLLHSAAPSTWAGDYLAYQRFSHAGDLMFVRDPADPVIPYRSRPGFEQEVVLPSGLAWSCRINSMGFRGPEWSPQKPAGTWRVLCIGGSTTFWGYSDAETYPSLLQARLRARSPSVEVLNLGTSGYTSAMNAERFAREYRGYGADLVIAYEGVNDITTLAEHRYRHRVARSLLLASVWNLGVSATEGGESPGLVRAVEQRFDAEIATSYDRLRRDTEAAGARLLVLTFPGPDFAKLTESERRYLTAELYRSWRELGSLEAYRAALDLYNAKLRGWAEAHGVALVDLAERVSGGSDLFMDICHMNTDGLRRIAGEVAAEIEKRGWAPAATAAATPTDTVRRD